VLFHWKRSLRPARNEAPKPETRPNLSVAWKAATPEQRRELLDGLGRAGLCAALSPKLLAELAEHVVGLQVTSATATQALLTQLLRVAIATRSEHESAAAIAKIRVKLKANNRTAGDLIVAFCSTKRKRPT
jgi:hypothetical protein